MVETFALTVAFIVLVILAAPFAAARIVLGPKAKDMPKPGEKWRFLDGAEGPWPKDHYAPVTVSDVRDGWVRYDMSAFKDQRLRLDSFVRMYRKVDA